MRIKTPDSHRTRSLALANPHCNRVTLDYSFIAVGLVCTYNSFSSSQGDSSYSYRASRPAFLHSRLLSPVPCFSFFSRLHFHLPVIHNPLSVSGLLVFRLHISDLLSLDLYLLSPISCSHIPSFAFCSSSSSSSPLFFFLSFSRLCFSIFNVLFLVSCLSSIVSHLSPLLSRFSSRISRPPAAD